MRRRGAASCAVALVAACGSAVAQDANVTSPATNGTGTNGTTTTTAPPAPPAPPPEANVTAAPPAPPAPPPAPPGTAFAKSGDYTSKVCANQPGSYAATDSNGTTTRGARCASLDAGELGFCSGVAWDACVRTDPPLTLDRRVLSAFDTMTLAQAAMYPLLAGDPECLLIMAEYMCALTFPRCDPDPVDPLVYYELPACWGYCMNSVFACTGDMDSARVTCNASLASGAVAPEGRPDIRCTSAGVANAARWATFAGVFALAFALA